MMSQGVEMQERNNEPEEPEVYPLQLNAMQKYYLAEREQHTLRMAILVTLPPAQIVPGKEDELEWNTLALEKIVTKVALFFGHLSCAQDLSRISVLKIDLRFVSLRRFEAIYIKLGDISNSKNKMNAFILLKDRCFMKKDGLRSMDSATLTSDYFNRCLRQRPCGGMNENGTEQLQRTVGFCPPRSVVSISPDSPIERSRQGQGRLAAANVKRLPDYVLQDHVGEFSFTRKPEEIIQLLGDTQEGRARVGNASASKRIASRPEGHFVLDRPAGSGRQTPSSAATASRSGNIGLERYYSDEDIERQARALETFERKREVKPDRKEDNPEQVIMSADLEEDNGNFILVEDKPKGGELSPRANNGVRIVQSKGYERQDSAVGEDLGVPDETDGKLAELS